MPLPSTVKHNLFEEIIHLSTQNYRLLNTTGKLPNHVCVTLVLRAVGVSIILSFSFFLLLPKFCPAVLWESCKNWNLGWGEACCYWQHVDGLLLLVQQARKSMSQPAECAVNWPTEVGRNLSLQQIFVNKAFVPTPRG
jgi:hypothetical protein